METYWKNDLSERFSSMTVKELRQSMRRGSFVFPFLAIQLMAVAAVTMEFSLPVASGHGFGVDSLFTPFWWVAFLVCGVIMPLGGLVLMRQELEENNHELLLLTKLNRWKVVLGKFGTLWGLCALTLISLAPYMVVRYQKGGIEWAWELGMAGGLLGGSAVLCSLAIGASSFRSWAARAGLFCLQGAAALIGCGICIGTAAGLASGWLAWLNALVAVVGYSALGLALARSKLRLTVHAYETKPSNLLIALIVVSPFLVGVSTLVTGGRLGGIVGCGLLILLAARTDVSFRAPKWIPPPPPNVPSDPPPAA